MFKGAEEGTFTICAHSSLPQSAWELWKINVTTYPCKLPKPNPEAISIYSASTMRCFMLKRNIKHIFMASLDHWQEKKKGNIQESLTCCTHTGTLAQETGPPKSLTLPCLSWDYRSVGTGHKEERTNSYYVISPADLDFLPSGASQLTQLFFFSFSGYHFVFSSLCRIVMELSRPTSTAQEGITISRKPALFSILPESFKILSIWEAGQSCKEWGITSGCCLESPSILKVVRYTPPLPIALRTKLHHS